MREPTIENVKGRDILREIAKRVFVAAITVGPVGWLALTYKDEIAAWFGI